MAYAQLAKIGDQGYRVIKRKIAMELQSDSGTNVWHRVEFPHGYQLKQYPLCLKSCALLSVG
jgi:hypothetical protein